MSSVPRVQRFKCRHTGQSLSSSELAEPRDDLDLSGSDIESLPPVNVRHRLVLNDCVRLKKLPDNLQVGILEMRNCAALEKLPSGLRACFLDLQNCQSLRMLPSDLRIGCGRLVLRDCVMLQRLPAELGSMAELDLAGCLNIREVPGTLRIASSIDVAGTSITALPEELSEINLRWRGVRTPRRVIFEPETLTPEEILAEQNAELRRVMIERYGYDKFLQGAGGEVIDEDADRGGKRQLIRVPLEGDQDLMCVSVICPSTGHHFMLRVPPTMTTCREAVAWTAGFDDPNAYKPDYET